MSIVKGLDNSREEQLCRLMDRYEKDLLRMCCMYLRDMTMAEDAVQETFLKAYNALSSFRGDSSEKTWLYRIAVNVCNDMRRNAWYRFIDRRIDLDRLQIPVEAQSEESLALMTEIMRLPRKWMEVVLLYYYEDIRIPQIAEMLGVSQTMVSRRLKKARELLKTQWRE